MSLAYDSATGVLLGQLTTIVVGFGYCRILTRFGYDDVLAASVRVVSTP